MADYAALPLFTDAYMADCSHLSDAEHGRYLLLLMLMWRTPGCRVPNDPEWLARKLRRTVDAVRAEVMPLVREFCQTDGNWITQKRLQQEHNYVTKRAMSQSERAKTRWLNAKINAGAVPAPRTRHRSGNAPSPSPSPSPSKRDKSLSPVPETFEPFYQTYPRHEGKGAARAAYRKAVKTVSPEVLQSAAERFAEICAGKDPQYVPHPATWLNQERWLDEPKELTNGHAKPAVNGEPRHRDGWAALAAAKLRERGDDEPF